MTDDIDTDTTDAARTGCADALESLADPESLLDRGDVDSRDRPTVEHGHHFEMYEPIDGMAIAGVTDDEGRVLLLVDREAGHAVLPYGRVGPGEDWAAVARRRTEELTGVAVSIDGPVRVRRNRYRPEEGDDDRETTGYDVVFRASPVDEEATAEVGTCEDNQWEAAWVSEIPAGVSASEANGGSSDESDGVDAEGDVLADIQLFIE